MAAQRAHPHVVVVGIQKGGAGKTSITTALAGAWARAGYRVGVADFDPQCNATSSLLGRLEAGHRTIEECLWNGVAMEKIARPAAGGIQVYPGTPVFKQWEDLLHRVRRDVLFRGARKALHAVLPKDIDVLLIDTPPGLMVALQFALSAADSLVVPTRPEKLSIDGFAQLLETVSWTQTNVNPELKIGGIVLNGVQPQTIEHSYWVEQVRKHYPGVVLEPPVPLRIAVSEAHTRRLPLEYYAEAPADLKATIRHLAGTLAEKIGLGEPEMAAAVA